MVAEKTTGQKIASSVWSVLCGIGLVLVAVGAAAAEAKDLSGKLVKFSSPKGGDVYVRISRIKSLEALNRNSFDFLFCAYDVVALVLDDEKTGERVPVILGHRERQVLKDAGIYA